MIEYRQYTEIPAEYVQAKIEEFLAEDSANNDVTTLGSVPETAMVKGIFEAQSDLVFAGEQILKSTFLNAELKILVKDGAYVKEGDIIAEVYGAARYVLSRERVALNLLQRTCGIASTAHKYAQVAQPYGVRILDTRKTIPGLRLFDKFAVTAGGAYNHRYCLASGVLIKDNHLKAAGGVTKAVELIKSQNVGLPVELEVDNFDQILEGLAAGVDGFLLDNMNPTTTIEAVKLIRNAKNGDDIFIESSGGITYETLGEYVKTGVNAISIGALTHSVKAADIHLEFELRENND